MAALTKMAIVKAFEELARVKNVDRITVKEITDKCQISRNTFYYHFKDIYDVLEEMLNQRVEQMIETLELNMQSGNSVQDTRRAGMRYILDNRELFFNQMCIRDRIWSREVGLLSSPKVRLPLTDEDLEQLTGLGEHLGYLDVDMQERTLKLYLEQLDLSID